MVAEATAARPAAVDALPKLAIFDRLADARLPDRVERVETSFSTPRDRRPAHGLDRGGAPTGVAHVGRLAAILEGGGSGRRKR